MTRLQSLCPPPPPPREPWHTAAAHLPPAETRPGLWGLIGHLVASPQAPRIGPSACGSVPGRLLPQPRLRSAASPGSGGSGSAGTAAGGAPAFVTPQVTHGVRADAHVPKGILFLKKTR